MTNSSIDQLVSDLKIRLAQIREVNADSCIGFMLGSTVANNPKQEPYATPIRTYENQVIFGAVVFNQIDAIILAKVFVDLVDQFYVDVEKKLPIDFSPNYKRAKAYGVDDCCIDDLNSGSPELGNISQAVRNIVPANKFIPYKANDLTVDAVWFFVSSQIGDLSGKNILLVGLGNIGSKLALKFVESGASVHAHGRDYYRDSLVVGGLNKIKSKGVLAEVSLVDSLEFGALRADIIILAASSNSIFNETHARCASKCALIIDIGKGNITSEALNLLHKRNITLWRANITDYLPVMLAQSKALSSKSFRTYGRLVIGNLTVISGGWIGVYGDVVVDDYSAPSQIIGVCDGAGGFLKMTQDEIAELLKKIQLIIKAQIS